MLKKIFKLFVELTGHPISSHILQALTKSRGSALLNRLFVRTYSIKMDEAERDLSDYKSLQSLFVRKLKPGLRPIDPEPRSLVSPVDGIISVFGKISDNCTFPVKGQDYHLTDLLGKRQDAGDYINGCFFVFYLSPGHYHRIHSPIKGSILSQWSLGKVSFPVNKLGLKYGEKPFSTNYRLISEILTDYGKVAVIKVGALNVNSIHLTHATKELQKGEEIGYFSFGSTVILLTEPSEFQFSPDIVEGMEIQYGQSIGYFSDSY
ncbi:MAG: phosphatidylserine decarboxylase [Tuberibacillus sp.]